MATSVAPIGSGLRNRRTSRAPDSALLASRLTSPSGRPLFIAQVARPTMGSQATANGAGRDASTAAYGSDATPVPSATITRSTSHAQPPANQVAASPTRGAWTAASTSPTSDAIALNSIAAGTNGTT